VEAATRRVRPHAAASCVRHDCHDDDGQGAQLVRGCDAIARITTTDRLVWQGAEWTILLAFVLVGFHVLYVLGQYQESALVEIDAGHGLGLVLWLMTSLIQTVSELLR